MPGRQVSPHLCCCQGGTGLRMNRGTGGSGHSHGRTALCWTGSRAIRCPAWPTWPRRSLGGGRERFISHQCCSPRSFLGPYPGLGGGHFIPPTHQTSPSPQPGSGLLGGSLLEFLIEYQLSSSKAECPSQEGYSEKSAQSSRGRREAPLLGLPGASQCLEGKWKVLVSPCPVGTSLQGALKIGS